MPSGTPSCFPIKPTGVELGLSLYDCTLKKINKGLRDGNLYYLNDGMPIVPYTRIVIRKIRK